jgi:uncharacterized OB-fold protein
VPDISHPDFAPYWEAARRNRLVVTSCAQCHLRRWPPRPFCRGCGSSRYHWLEVKGTATLYSWTTVGRAALPGFANYVPYTVAVAELDDEPSIRILATLEGAIPTELYVGAPLQISFREQSGVILPVWRTAERTDDGQD